ncbi:MAG: hypothetical protein MHM6MM_002269 [Cercozoa sp. M6MM]
MLASLNARLQGYATPGDEDVGVPTMQEERGLLGGFFGSRTVTDAEDPETPGAPAVDTSSSDNTGSGWKSWFQRDQSEQEYSWFSLTLQQRIVGGAVGGLLTFMFLLSALSKIPLILLSPSSFAHSLACADMFMLLTLVIAHGPRAQVKSMFGDTKRRAVSALHVCSIVLWLSVAAKLPFLVQLCLSLLLLLTSLAYLFSALPGGIALA